MIKFDKPINLNGTQLLSEIRKAGIQIDGFPEVDWENYLWLNVKEIDKNKVESIVKAHNGNIIPISDFDKKLLLLEKLGITDDEAKLLLG